MISERNRPSKGGSIYKSYKLLLLVSLANFLESETHGWWRWDLLLAVLYHSECGTVRTGAGSGDACAMPLTAGRRAGKARGWEGAGGFGTEERAGRSQGAAPVQGMGVVVVTVAVTCKNTEEKRRYATMRCD